VNTTHHLGLVAHDYGQFRNGVPVKSYRTVVSSTTKRPRCKRTLGANATACISVAKGRPRKVRTGGSGGATCVQPRIDRLTPPSACAPPGPLRKITHAGDSREGRAGAGEELEGGRRRGGV